MSNLTYDFFSSYGIAHYKPNPQLLEVTFDKGRTWNRKLPYKKQKKIGDHVRFLKKLYHEDKILFATHDKGSDFGRYWIKIRDRDEAQKILKDSPAVASGILSYSLKEVMVTMIGKNDHKH